MALVAMLAVAAVTPPPSALVSRPMKAGADPADDVNAPRRDARKVTFDVNEATWTSLDVSPDGTTIVFDLLGDLWLVPVDGGAARPLTSGPAWDVTPRFSPDGSAVAFASDRGGLMNLWVVGVDGADPHALTEEEDSYVRGPEWSPDGAWVVGRKEAARRGGIPPNELWMWHVAGGSGLKLTDKEDIHSSTGAAFSRDGRFIYFAAREGRFSYTPDLTEGLWQIQRLDRRTGETVQITEGFGGAVRPRPSPDGTRLVYLSRRDADTVLIERELSSGRERTLLRDVQRDEQEGFGEGDRWPGYAFTPDGASLVFSDRGHLARLDLATLVVRRIPFTASVTQWLAPRVTKEEPLPAGPVEARIVRWPTISRDGTRVAFEAFGRLWVEELREGKPAGPAQRITSDADPLHREHAPAFSPDGRSLAFVTWDDSVGGNVWKLAVPPAGSAWPAPTKLTRTPGHFANPRWSPKGDKLVVVRGSGLEFRGRQPEDDPWFEAAWLPASGGEPTFVASMEPAESIRFHPQAFFDPTGERIYFRVPNEPEDKYKDEETEDVVSVRLDGTDRRTELRLPVLGDISLSPDGSWLAFTSRDNAYITAMPAVHLEEPPAVTLDDSALPLFRLSAEAGSFLSWTDGGAGLAWIQARTLHRLKLADVFAFEAQQRKASKKDKDDDKDAVKVPASETLELNATLPRDVASGSLLLRGARLVTMKGDEVIESGDLLVTDGVIAAVGPSGTLKVPAGARTIDAAGTTIIPGLIDTHAHLHYSSLEVIPGTKWEYVANLAYGVTTVYDPSAPSLDTFSQAEMIEAGAMIGPRVFSSGDVLYGGKQADVWAKVESLDDAIAQVRRMKAYGARMIKVYQQPERKQRLWFIEACRREGMLATTEGAGELQTDLTMTVDGYTAWEHALPVELHRDAIELIARSGSYYTPTLLVAYGGPFGEEWFWQTMNPHDDPKLNRFTPHVQLDRLGRRHPWISPDEYAFPTVAKGVASVLRAGGHVALGAHGQLQGLGPHWELWAMAGEGRVSGDRADWLSPHEALRAATMGSADKIGFAPSLGSLEPGKAADLVVLEANPLEDIHATARARLVAKGGRLYDASSMRELWPLERDLPQMAWQRAW
jgi:Tol biopolymer transport system component/imidazolonepropionase-like amidohydrolase